VVSVVSNNTVKTISDMKSQRTRLANLITPIWSTPFHCSLYRWTKVRAVRYFPETVSCDIENVATERTFTMRIKAALFYVDHL
jgi:hypothetical protein